MSMNKQTKKRLILISAAIVVAVGLAMGIWFFIQYRMDHKTVEVLAVSDPSVATSYWGDTTYSSGTVKSDSQQELYPSDSQTVTDIFVEEGQQVSVGDPLVQYDKTKLELELESKDIAVKQAEIELDDAEDQLKKLQNTKPYTTPRPTRQPVATPTPTRRPAATPTPTPAPTPTPEPTTPPADVTLYSRLDADSKPYSGSGTTEDPYVFLCTEDCVMTREFLLRLLGDGSGATPSPEDVLTTPFAAVFEVREDNSNYGDLLYSFTLDGTQLSGSFQVSDAITGSNTLESVMEVFDAPSSRSTPTPTPNPNNYNDMGYTRQELNDLIAKKRQEIKDLQLKVDQAELDLKKAQIALDNSTVRSTIDGVVRTLTDVDTAKASSSPFLVVSGQAQFTVTGTLSESLLGSVKVGDVISAMSYDTGMGYSATITQISDYPLEGNYYSGSGNSNSSNYEFTAVLDGSEGLSNGMYLELTLNLAGDTDASAFYLYKPYIREDEGGSYVMKVGPDNRLYKQYLSLGKSIYSGEYVEVKGGLTQEDYIAFPYGNDVKEGVRAVVQGTEDPPFADPASDAGASAPLDGAASEETSSEEETVDENGNVQIMF